MLENLGKGNPKERKSTGVDSLGASKGPVPINLSQLSPSAAAKLEYWEDTVMSKWNIFYEDVMSERNQKDYEIERKNKIKILESLLEQLFALNPDLEAQKDILSFQKKLEGIEKESSNVILELKDLKKLMEEIHKFYNVKL